MPRASGSGKRQQGASSTNRESRHDNGLVSPAKQISSRKNNSHHDGSARSTDSSVAGRAGPSSATTPIVSQCPSSGALSKNGSETSIDARSGDALRRSSLGTHSEASSESGLSNGVANGDVTDSGVRQIDVNAMTNVDVHKDSGLLSLATTIIKSMPMQDTLAILIILMQLPYLSLTLVYASFALITFVPPVTTKTGMNINLAEILDGSSHTPSLVTIFCMDFFFFLFWVFLWPPIQDSILEFAKPVIAITLGGGTNARDGTSRGVMTCFTWILFHQAVRATKSHWTKLTRHFPFPQDWPLPALFEHSFESKTVMYDKRSTHEWIQSTLAMHILTQGLVRFVREWYLKREKVNAASGVTDPETAKLVSVGTSYSNACNSAHTGESAIEGGSNAAETEAGGTSQSSTATTNKRRRKQSAQARLQQPFWAALASSKIVAVKEYELSQWAPDPNASKASDIHNLGSAPFDSQPGQIWISYIGSEEVCFSTSFFPHRAATDHHQSQGKHSDVVLPPGVDPSKPFYTRINNAFWAPTRIFPVQGGEDEDADLDNEGLRWTGDIYALRPASTYMCEFVDTQNGEVVLSTTIRTVKETSRDSDTVSPGFPPGQQPLRPDSPTTIIRNSIAAEEARLAEERLRLKTWRKESKTRINSVKKENELVDNQLVSAGNSDDKHKQRIRQHEASKVQAERDTDVLGDQLVKLENATGVAERKRKLDKVYAAGKKLFDNAQKQFQDYQASLERDVHAKELEKVNLNSRRAKISLRIDKVDKELRNIADANSRGLDEAERRRQERTAWFDHQESVEQNYTDRLNRTLTQNALRTEQLRTMQAQVQGFKYFLGSVNGLGVDPAASGAMGGESGPVQFRQQMPTSAWTPNPAVLPHYHSGTWPGSSSDSNSLPASAPSAQTGATSAWHPPPTAAPFEPRVMKRRGRSSSMLSDVSGFTEPSDGGDSFKSPTGVVQRPGIHHQPGRNGTSGSSGSTGSGSLGEPASPR